MTMMKLMRLDNNFPLKSGNKGKHWLVSCMRCLTRNSAQMVQGPSLITQKLPKNLTSDFPTISRLLCFATSNVDSCNSYPKLNSAKFLSFHVVGWVSLVMLMLILKFMLLLVLVVISILKVLFKLLTWGVFLRRWIEIKFQEKSPGDGQCGHKVVKYWNCCQFFLEVFPFFLTPISFLCRYA